MRISDDLIEQVAGDPARGVVALQAKIEQVLDSSYDWTFDDYELLIEALALIGSLKEAGTVNYPIAEPKVTGNLQTDCLAIRDFFRAVISRLQVASNRDKYEALKSQFKSRFGGGHLYEFSQGDLDRVQQLINELREMSCCRFRGHHPKLFASVPRTARD